MRFLVSALLGSVLPFIALISNRVPSVLDLTFFLPVQYGYNIMLQCFTLALTSLRVHPSNNLFVFVPRERLFLVFMSPSSSRATLTELMVPTFGKGRLCVCTLKKITNSQRSNGFVLHVLDGWHIVSPTI